MKIFILSLVLVTGCSIPSSKFIYRDPSGASVTVEMPKELDAKNFKVSIDAKSGIATIEASDIRTQSVEVIQAQGQREAINTQSASEIVSKAAEGAVKGAMKGIVP